MDGAVDRDVDEIFDAISEEVSITAPAQIGR